MRWLRGISFTLAAGGLFDAACIVDDHYARLMASIGACFCLVDAARHALAAQQGDPK